MKEIIDAILAERTADASTLPTRDKTADQREQEQRALLARLEVARDVLPESDYNRLVLDNLVETAPYLAVQRWQKQRSEETFPPTILVLLGSTGKGKTLAALWLLRRMPGRYITAEQLRQIARGDTFADRDEFRAVQASSVLIIDDVGTEADDARAVSALYEMLNMRQGGRRWTVVTSNLRWPAFQKRYGERTVRRLRRVGLVVDVSGNRPKQIELPHFDEPGSP